MCIRDSASYGDYTGNFTYQDNMGSVLNHGIEGMFTWSDRINDWAYSVGANFVWSKNKVLKWNQVKHGEEYRYTAVSYTHLDVYKRQLLNGLTM